MQQTNLNEQQAMEEWLAFRGFLLYQKGGDWAIISAGGRKFSDSMMISTPNVVLLNRNRVDVIALIFTHNLLRSGLTHEDWLVCNAAHIAVRDDLSIDLARTPNVSVILCDNEGKCALVPSNEKVKIILLSAAYEAVETKRICNPQQKLTSYHVDAEYAAGLAICMADDGVCYELPSINGHTPLYAYTFLNSPAQWNELSNSVLSEVSKSQVDRYN